MLSDFLHHRILDNYFILTNLLKIEGDENVTSDKRTE